jgi:predicted lactoylglutathione lyase
MHVESKEEVDELTKTALEAGGLEPRHPQDDGWMYARAFQDIDGHLWEVFFTDESAMPKS